VPAAPTGADRAAIVTVIKSVATAQPIAQASATRNKNDCDTGTSDDDGRRQRCHFVVGAFLEPLMTIAVQKRLIARGLLAGAIGGLVAFAFARIIVEPVIGARAIPVGNRGTQAGTAGMRQYGAELFSHGLPANVGMACAVVAFGAAMGGLLAVGFAVSYGRLGSIRPGTLAVLLAADAFAALSVLPSVNYPPSPVSVGGDETATRTGLYLLLVGLSLALIVGAVGLGRRLAGRIGSWNAALLGAGAYGVGIAAAMWLLSPVDQTLKGFPANDVNALRLSSLVTHLVLWAAIAAVFARLASRLINERTAPAVVLRLDDYRERLASPAQTQVRDSETHVPATHGRYQR
jgi:Probable cobalt transporter subunit (CbtA)